MTLFAEEVGHGGKRRRICLRNGRIVLDWTSFLQTNRSLLLCLLCCVSRLCVHLRPSRFIVDTIAHFAMKTAPDTLLSKRHGHFYEVCICDTDSSYMSNMEKRSEPLLAFEPIPIPCYSMPCTPAPCVDFHTYDLSTVYYMVYNTV